MKKSIITILIIALIGTFAFAATDETARFKLSASVTEGPDNSGIKVVAGDQSSYGVSNAKFTELFDSADNDDAIDVGDSISAADAEGYFTVLVKRLTNVTNDQIIVNVSATPMKNEDGSSSYLPYKIIDVATSSNVINTLGNPSATTTGVTYIAKTPQGSVGIRHIKVFKYLIPKATNVEYGKYSATVFFSITIP